MIKQINHDIKWKIEWWNDLDHDHMIKSSLYAYECTESEKVVTLWSKSLNDSG